MTKPVLYTFELSIWSAGADIARVELGLADKVDTKRINVVEAENLSPEYIKINPGATVPALVADGKLYGDTAATIDYLISISDAKVAPATKLTAAVHDAGVDPNFAFVAARNDEELAQRVAGFPKLLIDSRHPNIKKYAALPESAAHKDKYAAKLGEAEFVSAIYAGTAPADAKAKFFAGAAANFAATRAFIYETLPAAIGAGPFVGGAAPGADDYNVVGWFFHTATGAGAPKAPGGLAAFEKYFGAPVPEKVRAYYEAWTARPGFKVAYPDDVLR